MALGERVAVLPREGHEQEVHGNPYIAYNCLRVAGDWAIATNGSQTDPIAEKVESGMPVRDALVQSLIALDYEKDAHRTPRIAAAVPAEGDEAWLAIVRHDALLVRAVPLEAGEAIWLATYAEDDIRESRKTAFDASNAGEAARYIVDGGEFGKLTHPVTSAAALADAGSFTQATHTVS